MARINALFVCSRNRWRSPTAERVFQDDPRLSVRARGLSERLPRQLQPADLAWADVIFVMERKHRQRILAHHRDHVGDTPICVLDIPDDYQFMDDELVQLLQEGVAAYFVEGGAE